MPYIRTNAYPKDQATSWYHVKTGVLQRAWCSQLATAFPRGYLGGTSRLPQGYLKVSSRCL